MAGTALPGTYKIIYSAIWLKNNDNKSNDKNLLNDTGSRSSTFV
jgi:hypothetical protein